jgi:hypothetical protein
VLVYAADRGAEGHGRCRTLLNEWRSQASPWYLTWGIVYEFIRVTTHPRVLRRPWRAGEAWQFVAALSSSPSLSFLTHGERHDAHVSELLRELPDLRGNLVHDLHTVALMREHGIRVIYTRDSDFHHFPNIEVRDPLRQRET